MKKKSIFSISVFTKATLASIIIATLTYLFLSLYNWSYHMGDWNGSSQCLLGIVGISLLFYIIDFF
jgi:hypothetical protein